MSLLRRIALRGAFIRPTSFTTTYTSKPTPIICLSSSSSSKNSCHSATLRYSTSPNLHKESSSQLQPQPPSSKTLLISEACKKRLKNILQDGTFLRVSIEGGGCSGFQYKFEIDKKIEDDDVLLSGETASSTSTPIVVIDSTSLDIVRGSTLDFEVELIRSAFRIINNPQAEQGCSCGASFNMKIN